MAVSHSGGPWGNGDGRLLYPPRRGKPFEAVVEGPVGSIRFENLRDGFEDREYLLMLRAAGNTALLERLHRDLVPTMTSFASMSHWIFIVTRVAGGSFPCKRPLTCTDLSCGCCWTGPRITLFSARFASGWTGHMGITSQQPMCLR